MSQVVKKCNDSHFIATVKQLLLNSFSALFIKGLCVYVRERERERQVLFRFYFFLKNSFFSTSHALANKDALPSCSPLLCRKGTYLLALSSSLQPTSFHETQHTASSHENVLPISSIFSPQTKKRCWDSNESHVIKWITLSGL